jgi:hypothetical protein
VAAGVLAEAEVAGDERGANGWEVGGAEVAGTEEFVDGPGGDFGEEGAADVGPAVAAFGGASADEDRARRAEGDEFVGVDGHVGGGDLFGRGLGIAEVVAGHPVVLAGGGDVFELLAVVAAGEVGSASAG